MKFKTYVRMKSCPSVKLDASVSPLDFKTSISGAFRGEAGPFAGKIGEIPVRMSIPFLKRRRVVVASIGGFPLALERFSVNVEEAGLNVNGTIGLEGIRADIDSKIDCSTDMDIKGHVEGKVGLPPLNLVGDEEHARDEVIQEQE